MKHNKWVVVINSSKMKIFTQTENHLTHLQTLHNDLLKYSNQELGRHSPGTISEGGRFGSAKHVMSGSESPKELEVEDFARKMASYLDQARKNNLVSQFVMIAEPRLMGLIRKHFSRPDFQAAVKWIGKDLTSATTQDLEEAVAREAGSISSERPQSFA